MKVCLVGGVVCDFVCITPAKLQSTAYWYGWFVKVLIHTSDAVSSLSSTSDESQGSSRTPKPTPPKRAPKNDPPGGLDGKLKNHKLVHIPPTKSDKMPT